MQLRWLQSRAEELGFLFNTAKENFSEGSKDNKQALGIFMGFSCQD